MEENKKKHISARGLIRALALVAALTAAAAIVWQLYIYKQGEETYEELRGRYTAPALGAGQEAAGNKTGGEGPDFELLNVDFEALRAQNPDVVGWIDFDAIELSYPVVWSGDNDTYLRTLWDGTPNTAGSVFMEGANTGWQDLHVILYGHNMRNRSMFGNLREYRDEDFYRENGGWFTLYTPEDGVWRYEIFGAKQVSSDDPLYTVGFSLGEGYTEFLKEMCRGRFYETGVTLYSEDHVMTLSTCVGDDAQRLVILARRAGQVEE